MDSEAQQAIRQVLEGIDSGDATRVIDAYTEDAVGIDEVSRGWLRGRDQIASYTTALLGQLQSCSSELLDVHESVTGDIALVTAILRQEYTLGGEAQSVQMPATFVLRRDGGRWRVLLFHALPIPE
ncbi:MAG: YybH family protein [Candidatus Nanopelagicales bacterium]